MALYRRYVVENKNSTEDFLRDFEVNVPENFNFAFDVVDELAQTQPDKLAMLWCNERGEEKRITFADMKRESDRAASFFRSRGVGRGDVVMLVLKRHFEFWYCIIALHKLGAVTVPATHLLTVKDYKYRFDAAGVKMIVCTPEDGVVHHVEEAEADCPSLKIKVLVRQARDGWLSFEEGCAAAPEFTRPAGDDAPANEDPMLLYFTSGTTGLPKMVAHDCTYPLGHIITGVYWHNVKEGGLHLTVADTGWGKAVWGKLYGQWLGGCAVMTYDFDKFVPQDILKCIEKYRVTSFCAPPTIYRFLIQEDLSRYDLSALEYGTVAGEALNPEVFEKFRKATGIELHEGFGQTETTLSVATYPWMKPKPGSMGRPSPGYDVDIVDDAGKTVSPGVVGEIVIRTDKKKPVGLFQGYYRDPNLTQTAWHDGIYHTGDVAWRDEEGYIWYVGRSDDVIKSSGYRIGPFEVESVMMEHPAVVEVAVTGIPHPVRGQLVKATVVLAAGYAPSDELAKQLQEYVKNNTAPYKYPRVVEFVAALPKTISGKIRRIELRN